MEWRDIHADRLEELAQVHRFSIKKRQSNDEIDFHINICAFSPSRTAKSTRRRLLSSLPAGVIPSVKR